MEAFHVKLNRQDSHVQGLGAPSCAGAGGGAPRQGQQGAGAPSRPGWPIPAAGVSWEWLPPAPGGPGQPKRDHWTPTTW